MQFTLSKALLKEEQVVVTDRLIGTGKFIVLRSRVKNEANFLSQETLRLFQPSAIWHPERGERMTELFDTPWLDQRACVVTTFLYEHESFVDRKRTTVLCRLLSGENDPTLVGLDKKYADAFDCTPHTLLFYRGAMISDHWNPSDRTFIIAHFDVSDLRSDLLKLVEPMAGCTPDDKD